MAERILIVDDDPTLRRALRRYLEARSYKVSDADSGDAGLLEFALRPADLVVSDVIMPGLDGYSFCRRLRESQHGQLVPFIFLTSRAALEDRIQGHLSGADDYLVKPFEPRELLAKIQSQLARLARVQQQMHDLLRQPASELPPEPLPLTPAEEKIFLAVLTGETNRQIGERLCISPRTVQTHLSNILTKLKLENRSQLVRYAYEHGYSADRSMV